MNREISELLKVTNYYQLLNVKKQANEAEIKQSYRALALKFHPDKNDNKGAKEIFAKISIAYSTLSNPLKRVNYNSQLRFKQAQINFQGFYHSQNHRNPNNYQNQFKNFAQKFKQAQQRASQNNKPRTYKDNPYSEFRKSHSNQKQKKQESQVNWMLIIIVFILICMLSMFNGSSSAKPQRYSSPFQMSSSTQYSSQMATQVLKIPYFVKKSFFDSDNTLLKQSIDYEIDGKYIAKITENCNQKTKLRSQFQLYAMQNKIGERRDYYNKKAKLVNLQTCNQLKRIIIEHPQYIRSMLEAL